ncbi:unnamed protein product, partial [Ectocarpus fasciculatus]
MEKNTVGMCLRWSYSLCPWSFVGRAEVLSCWTCASTNTRLLPCGLLAHHTPHPASVVKRFASRIVCRLYRRLVGSGTFRSNVCRTGLRLTCSKGQNVRSKVDILVRPAYGQWFGLEVSKGWQFLGTCRYTRCHGRPPCDSYRLDVTSTSLSSEPRGRPTFS